MGDCDYADGLWLCGRAVLQVDVLVLVIGKPASQCTPACVDRKVNVCCCQSQPSYVLLQAISCYHPVP